MDFIKADEDTSAFPYPIVYPKQCTRALSCVAIFLIAASTAGQFVKYATGYASAYGLVPLFFVGQENNLPTFFASFILLLSAVLLGVIAVHERHANGAYARHWGFFAGIFFYLSVDEVASLHELLIRPFRELLGTGGLLYFAWVIPFAVLLVGLAVYFFRFYWHLPSASRRVFTAAGLLYVGGAMGVELLGGRHADLYGMDNLPYKMYQTVEESMEIFGIVVFIYGLLSYMSVHASVGAFRVRRRKPEQGRLHRAAAKHERGPKPLHTGTP